MRTTWRKMLEDEGALDSVYIVVPEDAVLDVKFDDGYGGPEGPHFLVWTATHVWFPVCYDGSEWVASAPRNPGPDFQEGQEHVGGW